MTLLNQRNSVFVNRSLHQIVLLLLVPLAAIGQYALPLQLGGVTVYGYRLLVLGAVLVFAGRLLSACQESDQLRVFLGLGAIWIGWGLISSLWAPSLRASVQELGSVLIGLLSVWMALALGAGSKAGIHAIRRGWVIAYILTGLVALWELATDGHLVSYWSLNASAEFTHTVVSSTFGNPNNYAAFLCLAFPFIWWSWLETNGKRRIMYGLLLASTPVLLVLTKSRMGMLALPFEACTYLWLNLAPRIRSRMLQGIIFVIVVGAIALFLLRERLPSLSGSDTVRLNLARNGLHYLWQSFGAGIGPGGYELYALQGHGIYPTAGVLNAHSLWIEVLSQYGVLVFGLFCSWFAFTILNLYRATLKFSSQKEAKIGIMAVAGYLVMTWANSSYLEQPVNWVFLATYLSLVVICKMGQPHGSTQNHVKLGGSVMKICLLSSMHPPFDKRVFDKEAFALAAAGFNVTHLCPDASEGVERRDSIEIVKYKRSTGIMGRLLQLPRLYKLAARIDADCYHCNEVDSWFVGILLKLFRRKRVVFDVHEHYPSEFAIGRVPKWMYPLVGGLIRLIYRILTPLTDRIVLAKKTIAADFRTATDKVVVVQNFAPLRYGSGFRAHMDAPRVTLVHLGIINRVRGWPQLLEAVSLLKANNIHLLVIGEFNDGSETDFFIKATELGIRTQVKVEGWLPFEQAYDRLKCSDIGMVLFQPGSQNHVWALPHKMFDYMLAGLPVIVPEGAEEVAAIVNSACCGIPVDASDPTEIAEAIKRLASDVSLRKSLGQRGREAVLEVYNWESEAEKLIAMYRDMSLQQSPT